MYEQVGSFFLAYFTFSAGATLLQIRKVYRKFLGVEMTLSIVLVSLYEEQNRIISCTTVNSLEIVVLCSRVVINIVN